MGKILRAIVAVVMVLPMVTFGSSAFAASVNSVPITVTISFTTTGSNSLTVTNELTGFSVDYSTLSKDEAWVVAGGDIKLAVTTTIPSPTWGVRICTKNSELTTDYTGPLSAAELSPGVYSYGGLILVKADGTATGTTDGLLDLSQNPADRASLAWQISNSSTGASAVPTQASFAGGSWDAPWGYVVDTSNTGYSYVDQAWASATVLNYDITCYGSSLGTAGLASHPDTTFPAMSGSGTSADPYVAYVYLAARFANSYWNLVGSTYVEVVSFLPVGTYDARLYVEMFTE